MKDDYTLFLGLIAFSLLTLFVSWINIVFIPSRKKVIEKVTYLKIRKSAILLCLSEFIIFLIVFWGTKGNPIAFAVFVLIAYCTYIMARYCAYFNDTIISGAKSYWLSKKGTMKWENIQTVTCHSWLFAYKISDEKNRHIWLLSENYVEGIPNFFEHLKRYNPTVELKNINWEKIDKIIENGQNP
ncbi:MAG: hypothetical protein NTW61_09290 [Candidatus Melainabacteria bacterium]|nr:hypothetical protein [Candidatus Melainabacteria bacterium]